MRANPAPAGTDDPAGACVSALARDRLRHLLRTLLRARAYEALYRELPGLPAYPPGDARSIVPGVPAAFALDCRDDGTGDVFSLRRGSPAAALAFGLPPAALFRQALGRRGAPARGRDPGGFPTDLARGLLAPVPGPGTLVEVMAGIALTFRLRTEPRVALLVDDVDGSASGFWHEGLNLAGVRRAPLVLVVDARTRSPLSTRAPTLLARAPAYGVESHQSTAGDPVGLLETLEHAVACAREGHGAQLVEVVAGTNDEDAVAALTGRLRWSESVSDQEALDWKAAAGREMEEALSGVLAEPAAEPADAGAPVYPGGADATPNWASVDRSSETVPL